MLVSVVIPTYNRVGLLARAIDSVLAQQGVSLELIVVDDGSTDSTPSLLSGWGDPRLSSLRLEKSGVSKARNEGMRQARGEFIALLDSDDVWLPGKLEQQLRFMESGHWGICQTEERWIRRGRRVNQGLRHRKRAGWIFAPSLELCLVSPSCVVFAREVLDVAGWFDEGLPACEDYDLWLRASLHYPVGLLPRELTIKYGGQADQLSRQLIGLDLYRIYSLRNLLSTADLPAEKRRLVEAQICKKAGRYVQGCLKRDKPEEASRILELLAECVSPEGLDQGRLL